MNVSNLEFAARVREELAHPLSTPVQGWVVRTGERHEAAPVNPAFHLDEILLDPSPTYPRVVVKFRWDGETALFAVSYRVDPDDDDFNWGEGPEGLP